MGKLKKIYKEIKDKDGAVQCTIYGSNRNIKLFYKKPEWSEYEESAFKYNGQIYFLSEFMALTSKGSPVWMSEFNGYYCDSYFSGILVKINNDGETIKAYTYIN